MAEPLRVLCLNSGSSSLKLDLFALAARETRVASATVDAIGSGHGRLTLEDERGRVMHERAHAFRDQREATHALFDALREAELPAPDVIGHRVVHGGSEHTAPARVTAQLIANLRELIAFAPLHLPSEIAAIEVASERFAGVPQVACFDTSFHRSMPALAQRLPLPRALYERGMRRYGFHGLSYEYIVSELGADGGARIVIAHLGSGSSLCAVRDGKSLDTTMSFSPTGGVMMGTRTGDLDPELLLHLLRAGSDVAALERLVNRESGLLGVSGTSADMRTLLQARAQDERAAEAVELYCQSVKKQIGALAAVLAGLELLVFTGGIGEHAAPVRARVCEGLGHLGVRLDARANQAHASRISTAESPCTVRVIATDENLMIARHARALHGN
jgi:acetate kinase